MFQRVAGTHGAGKHGIARNRNPCRASAGGIQGAAEGGGGGIERHIGTQGRRFAVALRAAGGDVAIDAHRAAGIGGEAGGIHRAAENGRAGAVDRHRAQRAIGGRAHRAGDSDIAAAAAHREIARKACGRIHRAAKCDRRIGGGERGARAQRHRAGVALCATAGDGVGVHRGGGTHVQSGEPGDGVAGGIAKHRITDNRQAVIAAGHCAFGGHGAAGERGVGAQGERIPIGLRAAGGHTAAIDFQRARAIGAHTGRVHRCRKLRKPAAIDGERTQCASYARRRREGDIPRARRKVERARRGGIAIHRGGKRDSARAGVGAHAHIAGQGHGGGKADASVGGADIARDLIRARAVLGEAPGRADIACRV